MSVTDVLSDLAATTAWQEDLYTWLHRNPELSMMETGTTAAITERLTGFGYTVQSIGGGVVGVLENGAGPTVLFRADIDALPVKEVTGLPYASTKTATDAAGHEVPVMHACGHDVHITAALGAAEVLSTHRDGWSGTYIALFQPGEETAAGAKSMVADGLAEKIPHPDVAFAQHVLGSRAGTVGTKVGPFLSTAASVRVTVHGKGSHGSMPHLGIDPVVLAASIVVRLQTLVSREISPSDFGVVTVGSLQAGTAANVIPDRATMLLNVRAYNNEIRDTLIAGIERIVRAECEASRSPQDPEIEVYDAYPLTTNDAAVTAKVTAAFVDHFGTDRVPPMAAQTASEDFSTIPDSLGVPYFYWGLGGFNPGDTVLPNHNPGFAPAMEPTLQTGTEAAVVAALSYLGKDQ